MCPMIMDYLHKINSELLLLLKDNETNCKQQLQQIVLMVKDLKSKIGEGTMAIKTIKIAKTPTESIKVSSNTVKDLTKETHNNKSK